MEQVSVQLRTRVERHAATSEHATVCVEQVSVQLRTRVERHAPTSEHATV
jgi:hypothetical protein